MQSKQRMRERVIDISHGASAWWNEEGGYFENMYPETLGKMIMAIEEAFQLGTDTRMRQPNRFDAFDSPDNIVRLIRECIQYDAI